MKKKPSIEWTTVIVAIIGLIGIIITAILARESGERAAVELAIAATQTAEAKQITPTLVEASILSGITVTTEALTATLTPNLPTETVPPPTATFTPILLTSTSTVILSTDTPTLTHTPIPPTSTRTPKPTLTLTPFPPTPTLTPILLITPSINVYDDFEKTQFDMTKWGPPPWGNPQDHTMKQENGVLRIEFASTSLTWLDLTVQGQRTVRQMYALVFLDIAPDGGIGISIGDLDKNRYVFVLRANNIASIWDKSKKEYTFNVNGRCCPYSHLLGAIADGKQVIFSIDNEKIASFDLDGYPNYAGIHLLGTSPMVAGVDKVWLDFVK